MELKSYFVILYTVPLIKLVETNLKCYLVEKSKGKKIKRFMGHPLSFEQASKLKTPTSWCSKMFCLRDLSRG